jgi:hypothetical protein
MLAVVIMASQYPRVDEATRAAFYRLYLRRTDRINNWDLVDVTAPSVVGAHLLTRSRAVLRRLARSKEPVGTAHCDRLDPRLHPPR